LAATEHLHRRIARLGDRVRQLEDALSTLQAQHSSEPHPLLGQYDRIRDQDEDMKLDVEEAAGTPEVIEALGTLSISAHGVSRFFGPTGGTEASFSLSYGTVAHARFPSQSLLVVRFGTIIVAGTYFVIEADLSSTDGPASSKSPPSENLVSPSTASDTLSYDSLRGSAHGPLSLFSKSFPFTPVGRTDDVQSLIESYLPPHDRGVYLCEVYFDQVFWLFRGVQQEQLLEDMVPAIYARAHPQSHVGRVSPRLTANDHGSPHDLSLLFMIFAIAALVEPEHEHDREVKTENDEPSFTSASAVARAEHFYHIARAAISLQPVLEQPSTVTIQTLHLMSIYNALSGNDLKNDTSMEMTWSLITLAAHLSQNVRSA
jgi:hypothetical protein